MRVGETIKKARLEKGITSIDLAKRLGTSQSAISFIETNKRIPNDKTLKRISECLDIRYDELSQAKKEWVKESEFKKVDLLKAHEINTLVINSSIKGRCFLCNKALQLKGTLRDSYVLACECGLEIYVPMEEE